MRPKRRHGRFCAMRVAPAVGPLAIKIVRMVVDTAHLAASPSLTLFARPKANRISAGGELRAQFNFAARAGDAIAQLEVHPMQLGCQSLPAATTMCQRTAVRNQQCEG